jgi:hypothetical protein
MSNANPIIGTFHNVLTGEVVVRELTAEELAAMPQVEEHEAPSPD